MRKILLAVFCALILSTGAVYAVPVAVGTYAELKGIEAAGLAGSYILTADIDATDTDSGFNPIGDYSNYFTGTFDGNGYKIKNLHIDRKADDAVAFIAAMDGGTIRNVGLENVSIIGGASVASLVCYISNNCTAESCFVAGSVTTDTLSAEVGGLTANLGSAVNPATIQNCYSRCSVVTPSNVRGSGGFVGYTSNLPGQAFLQFSFSMGAVTVASYGSDGGFSGYNGNGFSANSCFWDSETSGQATSTMATGKTTAQMKTQSTYPAHIGEGIVDVAYDGDMYMDWVVTRVSGTSFDGMWMENITIDGTAYAISWVLDGDHMITACQTTKTGVAYSYGTGWDFSTIWNIDTTGVINDGYPYLRNVLPSSSGGGGTSTKRKPIVVWWN